MIDGIQRSPHVFGYFKVQGYIRVLRVYREPVSPNVIVAPKNSFVLMQ